MKNSGAPPQPKAVRPLNMPRYNLIIALIAMAFGTLIIYRLFDPRLSFATDDSTYIKNALDLRDHGSWPTFQGPLYPLLLLLNIGIFGLNIVALKVMSAIFLIAHIWVLYRALSRHVPPELQAVAVLLAGVNAYILAYGTFTFSEPLFMLLQAGLLWAVLRVIEKEKLGKAKPVDFLMASALIFLLSITRNVAFFAVLAPIAYFLIKRNYRATMWILLGVVGFRLVWEIFVRLTFGDVSTGQARVLLQKDYYDASQGYVTAGDLVERFTTNYGTYISVHFYKMMGLRKGGEPRVFTYDKLEELRNLKMNPDTRLPEPNLLLGLLFLGLAVLGIVRSLRHHDALLFIWLYLGIMLGITFVALQTMWNQDRLIVTYLPLMVLAMCYSLVLLTNKPGQDRIGRFAGMAFGVVVLLASTFVSFRAMDQQSRVHRQAKRGAVQAYPAPIASYIDVAQWVGKNLGDTVIVACAKPEEASIYGYPASFTRIGKLTPQADTILDDLSRRGIHYLLADQAGLPKAGQAASIIQQQRPEVLLPLYQGQFEPRAFLFGLGNR